MPPKAVRRAALKLAAAAAAGLLIPAIAQPLAIALTAFVPVLWLSQHHRVWAYASSGAYYLSAIWPVIPLIHRFNGSFLIGFVIWAGAALLLAVPWLIFRPQTSKQALWCGPAAMLAATLPPLGLIGVGSPLSAAGFLLPGTKMAGLIAVLLLPGILVWRPRRALPLAAGFVLLANAWYSILPPHTLNWEGMNTEYDSTPGAFADYLRIQAMFDQAVSSKAKVIVFPEAMIRSWTPTILDFFEGQVHALRASDKTVLVGALIPEALGHYRNVVRAFGTETASLDQSVPVPIAMWHPLNGQGVPLNVFGQHLLAIHGQKVAVLICYELMIPWPEIALTVESPTVGVAIARQSKLTGDRIARIQLAYFKAWCRLWAVPPITAFDVSRD